jgi:hypothetical protein
MSAAGWALFLTGGLLVAFAVGVLVGQFLRGHGR